MADWLAETGPAATLEKIRELLSAPDAHRAGRGRADRALPDHRIRGRSGRHPDRGTRWLRYSRRDMLDPRVLLTLAPELFWFQFIQGDMNRAKAQKIGDTVLRATERLGQVDLQGLHERGAARLEDGEVVWHLGDRLLREGQEYPLASDNGRVWVESAPYIRLGTPATDAERVAFRDAVLATGGRTRTTAAGSSGGS